MTYLAGMLWQEMKQVNDRGLKEYFNDAYNITDWLMINLYITSLSLYFLQYLMVCIELIES
jgi:hypothetical protein